MVALAGRERNQERGLVLTFEHMFQFSIKNDVLLTLTQLVQASSEKET